MALRQNVDWSEVSTVSLILITSLSMIKAKRDVRIKEKTMICDNVTKMLTT